MLALRQIVVGTVAAAAMALLPMAPAMAHGHGFRPLHPFGLGLLGAAVTLATLPLVLATDVIAGVGGAVAPYPEEYAPPAYGYAPQGDYGAPRPYYAPYPRYYRAPMAYGPRPYYHARPGYDARRYYRPGGYTYPRR